MSFFTDAEIEEHRSDAEERMTSRCNIRRKTGATQTNDAGDEVDVWDYVYTDLPTRTGSSAGSAGPFRTVKVGDSEVQIAARIQSFPASTVDLRDGDLVDLTVGPITGKVLQIAEATWKDQATARRVPVFEVQRPKEWTS